MDIGIVGSGRIGSILARQLAALGHQVRIANSRGPGEGMVEEIVKTYHVAYERDASGWWVASVRELRGCRTQGRTVDEARRRIREAIGLFIDNVRTAKIVDNVKLPADAKKAISAYAKLRKKADENDRRAGSSSSRSSGLTWQTPEDERT